MSDQEPVKRVYKLKEKMGSQGRAQKKDRHKQAKSFWSAFPVLDHARIKFKKPEKKSAWKNQIKKTCL